MAVIKIDIEKSGYECPICDNDEIELEQNYCQICGEELAWKEDD